MKIRSFLVIIILSLSSQLVFSQIITPTTVSSAGIDYYYRNSHAKKVADYTFVEGSPYLNSQFVDGVLYLKDSTSVSLPLRYNLYSNEMEYQYDGSNYTVGNPQSLQKAVIGNSEFVYLPLGSQGGYYEIYVWGKCCLLEKKSVKFTAAEFGTPITGTIPAKFTRNRDVLYLLDSNSHPYQVGNIKSVIDFLQDQSPKIENFIKQEKIKNAKKENLIKIIKYYNSL